MKRRLSRWMQGHRGSIFASCAVHAVLLFGTSGAVLQPVRYEVEAGTGGMEVALIAAPLPPAEASAAQSIPRIPEIDQPSAQQPPADAWQLGAVPVTPPQEAAANTQEAPVESQPEALRQAAEQYGDGSSPVAGTASTTLFLSGGALSGRGGRLKNPAPPYPYAALRQQQEGLVLLKAVIGKTGRPVSVEIAQSSGFALLDNSALRTIRRWKFDAAHLGFLPVQSTIIIPVRFRLDPRLPD